MSDASRAEAGPRDDSGTRESRWGLRDRFLGMRDRLLASRRFQRWATGFPLTRPIARAQAQSVFDLCAGFVYSQVLLAVVRLQLLDRAAEAPIAAADVAAKHGLAPAACERLLDAAVALKLLSRRAGGRYGLGMLGAAMRANAGALAMIEHNALLYRDLADPLAILRRDRAGTGLGTYWAYARADNPEQLGTAATAAYTALMAASQSLIADDIIEAYPLRRHVRLMDVGGGDGTLLEAVARAVPGLQLALFDLPSVAAAAKVRLGATAPHAEIYSGSFLTDPLPAGADVVSLVRVLLDHDDTGALQILRGIRRAIVPGGTLLVAETLSSARGAERVSDAYFGMYLTAMGSGRPRSFGAMSALLEMAGFKGVRLLSTRQPMLTGLLKAEAS